MRDFKPAKVMYCHDPRISNDRNDRRLTTNSALMTFEFLRQQGLSADEFDWDKVAEDADRCDWPADKEALLSE